MPADWERYGPGVDAQQTGEGGGKEFQKVSDELRSRITDGTYPLGSFLPSQRDLAEEFGVSRDTVQRALRELAGERWIDPRQGSGTRVINIQRIQSSDPKATRSRHGATLGPFISEAFERPEVTLDVYTLTSESLDAHIRLQAERIRAGFIRPEHIALRMLLPSTALQLPYPKALKIDRDTPRLQARLRAITERHTDSLRNVLRELHAEKLVPSVDVQIRHAPLTPTFKLYLLNGVEALHGLYGITRRPVVIGDEEIDALDVLGLGATLTHHVKDMDQNSPGSVFVESMESWFESVWTLLSE